tara:strand:- start:6271 stop:6783 length:513 start_codon:yes stop_codon:yes gene_type:complete
MRYLLLIMTLMLTINLSAQRGGERAERRGKIEQQRIAFITTKLDFSVEEAQTFWPLYNDYQGAKKEIGRDLKAENRIDDMTEEESRIMLSQAMEVKKKYTNLEIEFMNSLERVLSAKKRIKLVRAEREFKKFILKRYERRMSDRDRKGQASMIQSAKTSKRNTNTASPRK